MPGLLAILDCCPLLESLDLRGCFHLHLSGSIGIRCNQQVKTLCLPTGFMDVYYGDDDPHLLVLQLHWIGSDIFGGLDF